MTQRASINPPNLSQVGSVARLINRGKNVPLGGVAGRGKVFLVSVFSQCY